MSHQHPQNTLKAYGGSEEFIPPPATDIPPSLGGPARLAIPPDAVPATERPQGATLIERSKLVASPTNPRKTLRGLEELAETIKAYGILQPLVARPRGDYYELVFGERRLRAGDLAGLERFPVLVREMSDLEVLEVQIVENVQRSDVDALEEADGYRVLHEKHGYSVPDIAAKIGKSVGYVYARLKLCALGPEGREALVAGKLTDSTALLIARIPLALQKDAVKELEPRQVFDRFHPEDDEAFDEKQEDPKNTDPVGAREAFARIQSKFMLRLQNAPFDVSDAGLVPSAGACTACPKRTGSQPELFADVRSADTCTDPTCFSAKRDAKWNERKAEAKAAGITVLEGKKAKEYFPYGSHIAHTSGMVDLDGEDYTSTKRGKTNRDRITKHVDELAGKVTIVRTEDGKVHELVPVKEFNKFVPKAKAEHEAPRTSPVLSAAEKLEREAERAGALVALSQVVKKTEAKELTRALWRILVAREIEGGYGDHDEVLERRGILVPEEGSLEQRERGAEAAIARLGVDELRSLYVELMLYRDTEFFGEKSELGLFCIELKIDVKQLVAKELARLKGEAKTAPATPAAKASAKKAKSVSGTAIAKAASAAKKKATKKGAKGR